MLVIPNEPTPFTVICLLSVYAAMRSLRGVRLGILTNHVCRFSLLLLDGVLAFVRLSKLE